jgi:predicted nucleotidyltransferase component of viral defense system
LIPQRNISLLANRLARTGGQRIPESVFERDYCLAWLLSSLAQSDLRSKLAFKGGTALKHCYFGDYRFSEDLDFTLLEPTRFEDPRLGLEPVYAGVREASGIEFEFDREDRHEHANSRTFYLRHIGPLPAGGSVKVDITIREQLVFPIEARPVPRAYVEFADLPDGRVVQAYSLMEIATEKVIALADRARNEPRDLYTTTHANLRGSRRFPDRKRRQDCSLHSLVAAAPRCDLWHLISRLAPAITAKLAFRNVEAAGIKEANQMSELPPFDQVFREFRRALRQSNLPQFPEPQRTPRIGSGDQFLTI